MKAVIDAIDKELGELDRERARLVAARETLTSATRFVNRIKGEPVAEASDSSGVKKRKHWAATPEGREHLRRIQKKRWAKIRREEAAANK